MCGIIGIAPKDVGIDLHLLTDGRDTMTHRGPDDAGVWWAEDGSVGLAHRRLAVMDLTPAGHQPMQDASGAFTIVFNGEIYNHTTLRLELSAKGHVFRSLSDTEVILASYREWGVDCLSRFNGMFAFALHDANQRVIFLARDRAGEKPLFYSVANGTFRFASELKGLLADQSFVRRINHHALDSYLAMGYVPGELCMVQGVNKLPAAHAMIFDQKDRSLRVWQYWSLPPPPVLTEVTRFDDQSLVDQLELLLEDAVAKQLCADVPVGVLLSGGVDSSLITAMAVRASRQVKTFSVGFEGFDGFNEFSHARVIAQFFGTEHIELDAGSASPELLTVLARQYDEPIADSSMIPTYLVAKMVREHCTVALGGDGGDELFGGYLHYDRALWREQKLSWVPRVLRNFVSLSANVLLPVGFKGRNWAQTFKYTSLSDGYIIASFFDGRMRRKLLGDTSWPLVAESIWNTRSPKGVELVQRLTRMDFMNYMVEDILVKVDRASMLNSLELRSPFLDYRIIEFAFGHVPSYLKANTMERKILLKKLTEKLLPPKFDRQRKQGFSVPLNAWLKNSMWRDFFEEVLFDRQSIFDKKAVASLLHGQDMGLNNAERLFSLVLFGLWRHEYAMTL